MNFTVKLTPCPYPCFKESSQEKVLGGVKKLIRGVKGVENIYTQENFQKVSFLISREKILNVLSVTFVKFQKHIPSFKSLIEKVCQGKSDPRLKTFGANPQTPLVSVYKFLRIYHVLISTRLA